ncbi:MAG: hypothetical protein Q9174_002276 [Haloplaca sp. 1 TL-2023]
MSEGNPISIAIVGIGLRLPGNVTGLDDLWTVLAEGRNCWTPVPTDRYNEEAYLHSRPDAPKTHNHRGGHFLSQDIAAFDAWFFHIPPAEAQAMDPQQRILLETTYDAFQSCGSTLESMRGSNTGVYIATFSSDYDRNLQKDIDDVPKYHTTGTGEAIAANRISHAFDLKGPSVAFDTGCSGSLVAIHYACQSLITGDVETAIAGGVNLILNPDRMIGMSNLGYAGCGCIDGRYVDTNFRMLNAEGRSYSFDSRGDGYGRGEGTAVVILKTLSEATRCGDPIQGIIRSTAVNQDGKTSGITSPSQAAQEMLVKKAYTKVSLDPRTVHYVEAHGTGTSVGDLAEIGAISEVFCEKRSAPLYVGSIKSNIGHLESVSGLASLIKAVLVLQKGLIPPNADFQTAKPELDLQRRNIIVPATMEPFPQIPNCRVVSVNSFGYGGTNAHVILEQGVTSWRPHLAPHPCGRPRDRGHGDDPPRLFVLSARSESSLRAMSSRLHDWASKRDNYCDLDDIAYTLLLRRSHFEWRVSFVAQHYANMLETMEEKKSSAFVQRISPTVRLTYIFTGQGSQWHAMGRELMMTCTTFKDSLDRSASVLQRLGASWDLIDELLRSNSTSRIHEVWLAQPATTAIQIALVDALYELGCQPQTVLGHSSGEIAAAYAAGFLSQAAAIQVSFYRGLVCKPLSALSRSRGAMLAVGMSEKDSLERIRDSKLTGLCAACINSPISTTISGDKSSVDKLHQMCQDQSIFSKKLNTGTAYHSHHMIESSTQYLKLLNDLDVKASGRLSTFISTVTATLKDTDFGPEYWTENLVSQVRFADAVSKFCDLQSDWVSLSDNNSARQIVVEIGPHPALSGAFRQTIDLLGKSLRYSYVPSLIRETNGSSSFLKLVGQLYEYGVPMDIHKVQSLNPPKQLPMVIHDLPSYPWNHSRRYWHESRLSKQSRFRRHGAHFLLGTQTNASTPLDPCWRNVIGLGDLPWLQDHRVDNVMVFPGAAYICMVLEAGRQHFAGARGLTDFQVVLTDVSFRRTLVIPEAPGKVELYLSLVQSIDTTNTSSSPCGEFRISSSANDGPWYEHCNGFLAINDVEDGAKSALPSSTVKDGLTDEFVSPEKMQENFLNVEELYYQLGKNGNRFGPRFKLIKDARISSAGQLISTVNAPKVSENVPSAMPHAHFFHPTILDAIFHSSLPLYARARRSGFVMPTSIDRLQISHRADLQSCDQLHVETTLELERPATAKAEIVAFDERDSETTSVVEISGLTLRASPKGAEDEKDPRKAMASAFSVLKYQPDAHLLSPLTLRPSSILPTASERLSQVIFLNTTALHYIRRSLDELQKACALPSESHLTQLKVWMELQMIEGTSQAALNPSETVLDGLELRDFGVEGESVRRIGESLTSILLGKVSPVDLMLRDDLLYNLYAHGPSSRCMESLSEYLKHLAFKRPRMKILEVGARTASTTLQMLSSLTETGDMAGLDHYVITDVASRFFDQDKESLARWQNLISFKTLDISKDPLEQGFGQHSYDLIIASNVLHATASIQAALTNIHKLLEPHGKLAIIEFTRPQTFLGMIFGTLPGWSLGNEDGRSKNSFPTHDAWEKTLLETSFNGLDTVVQDFDGPAHMSSLMITSPAPQVPPHTARTIDILIADETWDTNRTPALRVRSQLETHGFRASVVTWRSFQYTAGSLYLVLDCKEIPILIDSTPELFSQIVDLLTRSANIFWLRWCLSPNYEKNPATALINGLARSAHAENPSLRLVIVDVQETVKPEDCSKFLAELSKMVHRSFNSNLDHIALTEREYIYRDGEIFIPRVLPDEQLNHWHGDESSKDTSFSLDQHGSYLVAGGLGDIGMRDGTLSHISSTDFNLVLKAKVHGTRSLHAAFKDTKLDFFVMLSSISGLVGTSGQASYAASNAYQDAFASTFSTPNCPCISLNLPLIQDSNIRDSVVEQNLESHGTAAITAGQLGSLLEYAMSPQAVHDHHSQIIAGITADSVARTRVVNANANSAMFSHFRSAVGHELTPTLPRSITAFKESLSVSQNPGETHQLLVAAIVEKLSHLVTVDEVDHERDLSLAELGMDSLIVVELRNWISTELQAPIHTSEILDQKSTRELANLVSSRTALFQHKPDDSTLEADDLQSMPNLDIEQGSKAPLETATRRDTEKLPQLPLPELSTSLDMYLESRRHFLSPEELDHTKKVIAEFSQVGGAGRRLQDRLKARLNDPTIDNWLAEPYSRRIYLERRDPVHPCGTFYGGHLLTETAHSQAERAAIIAVAAWDFKTALDEGTLEREFLNNDPICTQSLGWLFNAVREPRLGMDTVSRWPAIDYMIVIRRGHIFQVGLGGAGPARITYQEAKSAFETVLISSQKEQTPIAALTADGRDSWSKLRQHFMSLDEVNGNVLKTIERAAFLVCLDEGQPGTASERCNQFFLGDPANRWSDKTLQFVVCENGVSAMIGEHSMLDGMSVRQLNRSITKAVQAHEAVHESHDPIQPTHDRVHELFFVTDPEIETRTTLIRESFRHKYSPIELVHHEVNDLGAAFLRAHKCPSKAGYQVIIQLACLIYYGYQPDSWETVSMSRFHLGRVDWIQAVQPPMAHFCSSALNTTLSITEKRRLFFSAVNNFANTMTQISRGHGFKAHMHALLAMVREEEPLPALFHDKSWQETAVASVKTVKTDCLEGAMLQETAFLMPEPRCIFLHYEVEEERSVFPL